MANEDQRLILAIVVVIIALVVILPLMMWAAAGAWMESWGFPNMMGGWWPLVGLGMGLPLIIIVVILLIIMREERQNVPIPPPPPIYPPVTPPQTAALQVLEMRYARGELSREEYWRMREELTGGKRPGS